LLSDAVEVIEASEVIMSVEVIEATEVFRTTHSLKINNVKASKGKNHFILMF
jgi:hypothetical protein